jgi:predicted dehydrogenase
MPKKKIRVGIVGAGFISQVAHIPSYVRNPKCEVIALAELRTELGKSVCRRWNIPRFYSSHTSMLEDKDIDLVVVVVKRHHTGPIARDVLLSGKNLFTEKPMAQTKDKALYLSEIATKSGLKYSVGFMRRYDDGIRLAKYYLSALLKSKELGEVLGARAYLSAGGDYCNIGGDLKSSEPKPEGREWPIAPSFLPEELHVSYEHFVNVCIHDINLLRFMFEGHTISPKYVEYNKKRGAIAVLDFGDFCGTFDWSETLQPTRWDEGLEIRFQRGYLKLNLKPAFLRNQPAEVKIYTYRSRDESFYTMPCADWTWAFENEANAMIDGLLGNIDTISTAEDSVKDFDIIDDIWRIINSKE